MATPSRSTIRPTICAPNSELPSASGIRDESATGCEPLAAAGVPAAGDGVDDGLICGNRLEALPPGIVVETPATAGSGPIGMFVARPAVVPDRPGMVAVDPLGDGFEPPATADGDLDWVGVGVVVAVLATVTVGAVARAVRFELPFGTVTVTLYWSLSPPGAFFGTLTCISTCGVGGLAVGTLRSQVVPVVLVQLPAVNVGVLNAGVLALGVSLAAIEPLAAADRVLQAEMRNRIVPPACTLVAEGVTVMSAVGVVVVLVVGVGVGVGGSVALAELPLDPPLVPLDVVLVADGVGVGEDAVALGELAAWVALGELAAWVALGELAASVAVAAWVALAVPEAEVEAEADGETAASAVPVTPLETMKRPVAKPTVTGRECADRMRTPCLCCCRSWKRALRDVVLSRGLAFLFGRVRSYSTPKLASYATPHHT
jgi:hypothetical protein